MCHLLGLQKLEFPPEITSLTITLFAVSKGGDHTRQRLRAYACRQTRARRPRCAPRAARTPAGDRA
jgi:hypothetical protein